MMSFENKGSMPVTVMVSREPDRSGNFVCDGTADDVQIQAATDYVSTMGGGKIFIKEGTYIISATITVPSYIMYEIRGVLWLANNADVDMFDVDDNAEFIEFYGAGRLYGNKANQTIAVDGIDISNADRIWIHHMRIENFSGSGIFCTTQSGSCRITDNWINQNDELGIRGAALADSLIAGNSVGNTGVNGISVGGNTNIIIHNEVFISVENGIYCSGERNIIAANISHHNGKAGVTVINTTNVIVADNMLFNNGDSAFAVRQRSGILVDSSSEIIVTGNDILDYEASPTQLYGIFLYDADYCTVSDNTVKNHDRDGIAVDTGSDYNSILANIIRDNTLYGITIVNADCDGNLVKDNVFTANTSGSINDVGTNTKLATKTFQFIQGTTFISATGNPWGWEIDADTEFALALGQLPLEVQQVIRIKIWAVGLVSPGVSPGYMRAQFTGEAGASDEPYTTEPIDVVDKNCEEDNFAANDVIHWVLDATDDADIGDLLGGDSIQFKVLHEGGAGDDIETDAIFRCVEIEYV